MIEKSRRKQAARRVANLIQPALIFATMVVGYGTACVAVDALRVALGAAEKCEAMAGRLGPLESFMARCRRSTGEFGALGESK